MPLHAIMTTPFGTEFYFHLSMAEARARARLECWRLECYLLTIDYSEMESNSARRVHRNSVIQSIITTERTTKLYDSVVGC